MRPGEALERARRAYAPWSYPKVPRYKLVLARLFGERKSFDADGVTVLVADWHERTYVVGFRAAENCPAS